MAEPVHHVRHRAVVVGGGEEQGRDQPFGRGVPEARVLEAAAGAGRVAEAAGGA